jgi:hypothetical protein
MTAPNNTALELKPLTLKLPTVADVLASPNPGQSGSPELLQVRAMTVSLPEGYQPPV